MRKALKQIALCALISALVWVAMIVSDKQTLQDHLIRLHVVASSDESSDQELKLRVRDAVIDSLRSDMENFADMDQAKAYLQENLPKIEDLANQTLRLYGSEELASVSLKSEEFPVREYDTFTLPSGIYESLRITIGKGEGRNWWCVVFPALCVGSTVDEFEETAQCAGLSSSLTATLSGEEDYEVRFLALDVLGKLENFLHKG